MRTSSSEDSLAASSKIAVKEQRQNLIVLYELATGNKMDTTRGKNSNPIYIIIVIRFYLFWSSLSLYHSGKCKTQPALTVLASQQSQKCVIQLPVVEQSTTEFPIAPIMGGQFQRHLPWQFSLHHDLFKKGIAHVPMMIFCFAKGILQQRACV